MPTVRIAKNGYRCTMITSVGPLPSLRLDAVVDPVIRPFERLPGAPRPWTRAPGGHRSTTG